MICVMLGESSPINDLDDVLAFSSDYLNIDEDAVVGVKFDSLPLDCAGFCDEFDSDEEMIVVVINTEMEDDEIRATVFHEMSHVSQILTGRRVQEPSMWEGYAYDDTTDYELLPWEIDAYNSEREMVQRYQLY